MKGDFSRITFDPSKQFTRVLMQQGRVQLDADWNEQSAILLHYLQTLAADLIGSFGGPEKDLGFGIETMPDTGDQLTDLKIGTGRYYVDGILCENPENEQKKDTLYFEQPSLPLERETNKLPAPPFLVYLDVWERHVTHLEDGLIREVALGGPDTATRAQVVWQVRVTDRMPDGETRIPADVDVEASWPLWVKRWQPENRGSLKARAKAGGETDPCTASPDARYRGAENQLYRVEIHKKGKAGEATFKWSRDNGSVTFPILDLDTDSGTNTTTVTLEHLGQDGRLSLSPEDWVEIVDDGVALGYDDEPLPLLQVEAVDSGRARVTLRKTIGSKVGQDPARHPLLRRWDQGRSKGPKAGPDGDLKVVEGPDQWLDLEDGVQISFQPAPAGSPASPAFSYRAGDYWLIPARTATGDVEWPGEPADPKPVPPHGVEHHYAPLALRLARAAAAGTAAPKDLRKKFAPLGN